jgi:hypothetical protein
MNAQTEILLLYLLWFNDERVVFEENELKTIEKIIEESMGPYIDGNEENKEGTWRIYKLKEKFIQEMIKNESPRSFTTKSVEMGYYHHRIIFKIILDFKGNFRDLRGKIDELKENCDKKVTEIGEKISSAVLEHEIRPGGEVVGYSSYPLVIWKEKPAGKVPFSEDTTSMSFDIFEVAWPWKLNWRPWRWHTVRISIPRMIVYTGGLSDKLERDIINAIYEHCLYKIKARREDKPDEKLLIHLWDRMMDTLARARSEIYLYWLTFVLAALTFILIGLGSLSYLPSLFSYLFTLIKNIIFP